TPRRWQSSWAKRWISSFPSRRRTCSVRRASPPARGATMPACWRGPSPRWLRWPAVSAIPTPDLRGGHMHISSESFGHGQPIPAEFAFGTPDGLGGNRNPQLAWGDAPAGTRSFALLCIDPDAPTDPALVANDREPIPVEHARGDFAHWALVDIPADVTRIDAGSCSEGVTRGGQGPESVVEG